ncbi:MAG: 2-oxo acid dehydrogenase subunit E2, partial [Reichenbachiella sp.]
MALVEMVMPKMGESIMEGTILAWLKKVGDEIDQDESVLEVATDKVDTEVPSTISGVLKEILANEGDVVEVGKPIAIIESDQVPVEVEETPAALEESVAEIEAMAGAAKKIIANPIHGKPNSDRFYSPLVMNIVREENISMEELEALPGTGMKGRVTKKDILALVRSKRPKDFVNEPGVRRRENAKSIVKAKVGAQPTPTIFTGEDEIIEMDRMRKMIADRMLSSVQTAPHVTSFVEADLTEIVKWRGAYKKSFMESTNEPLTFTPIFVEAVASAIRDYPMINVQVEGDKIIKKGNINIGIAVALPSGNLIVPVIKNADRLSIKELALAVNDLARRGRDNKLNPDDLSDGTYTISNVGGFGNL